MNNLDNIDTDSVSLEDIGVYKNHDGKFLWLDNNKVYADATCPDDASLVLTDTKNIEGQTLFIYQHSYDLQKDAEKNALRAQPYAMHDYESLSQLWKLDSTTLDAWKQVENAPKPCDSASFQNYFSGLNLCNGLFEPQYVDLATLPKESFQGPEVCQSDLFLAQQKMSKDDCLTRQMSFASNNFGFFSAKPAQQTNALALDGPQALLNGTLQSFNELEPQAQVSISLGTLALAAIAARFIFNCSARPTR